MTSFKDLTKQVQLINDIILADMVCERYSDTDDRVTTFSHHLLTTKYWFSRISWANKKRYVLALLEDVQSAWTLSLLLKSMWNCRPKDAVLSASEQPVWSSYDQVPMDHNRTAMPVATLAQVMKSDRMWFLTLDAESQAMVLSELLTIAGGPVMWAVLRRAQTLYERYRKLQLQNLQECLIEMPPKASSPPNTTVKKEEAGRRIATVSNVDSADNTLPQTKNAQKELEANLAEWNATIKALRDSQKIEELEMISNDGTKQKIWMVNRPKPEAIETVDFLQLLPAAVGKRVLSYVPRSQLGEYARVNKYWAFLVEELKAELAARHKINADLERLRDLILRHNQRLEPVGPLVYITGRPSTQTAGSGGNWLKENVTSVKRSSVKSAGVFSMGQFLEKPSKTAQSHHVRNVADLTERLETRGAADQNLWRWCDSILHYAMHTQPTPGRADGNLDSPNQDEGVLPLPNAHFRCPMLKHQIKVPLKTPLYKDPAKILPLKHRKNISASTELLLLPEQSIKRYGLWTHNFGPLYNVVKLPSYQSPLSLLQLNELKRT